MTPDTPGSITWKHNNNVKIFVFSIWIVIFFVFHYFYRKHNPFCFNCIKFVLLKNWQIYPLSHLALSEDASAVLSQPLALVVIRRYSQNSATVATVLTYAFCISDPSRPSLTSGKLYGQEFLPHSPSFPPSLPFPPSPFFLLIRLHSRHSNCQSNALQLPKTSLHAFLLTGNLESYRLQGRRQHRHERV